MLLGLVVASCNDETPTSEEQEQATVDLTLLTGEWVIDSMKVRDKIRSTMDGGIFHFVDEKTFIPRINLDGTGIEIDQPIDYQIEDKQIKIKGNQEVIFDIQALDATKMALESRIRGLGFKFYLSRKE